MACVCDGSPAIKWFSLPRHWVVVPAFSAPIIAYLAPLGLWAPLLAMLLLVSWDLTRDQDLRRSMRNTSLPLAGLLALALPLLGLATAPWSLLPGFTAQRSLAVLIQMVSLLLLLRWQSTWPQRWRWTMVLTAGLSATGIATLTYLDFSLGSPIARLLHGDAHYIIEGGSLSRGAALHGFLVLPSSYAALCLWRSKRGWLLAATLLILNIALLARNANDTAYFALLIGGILWLLVGILPQIRWVVPILAATLILAMPLLVAPLQQATYCTLIHKAPSLAHRLGIWNTVAPLIAEHPLFGWGLDNARAAPGGKVSLELRACDANGQPTGKIEVIGESIPLHPHNGALDLWFCLGAAGAISAAGAVALALTHRLRQLRGQRWPSAITVAVSAQLGLTALISYGLWQAWFISALSFSCMSIAAITEPSPVGETRR
ncbi:O-antigen ligase family protein [Insolitispirillum peregrinum]|uniref:O-antigen ligase n=1 Tax=Insolitispirillum peregrinum TaxID=80876 RepID=A0A1N7LUC2_9PROT|nr:O-antigen ligase family protein [Insolitispirillum peregrinum]SIS77455.1 O-antigen ligase [Insolitispirillum peregrinum]